MFKGSTIGGKAEFHVSDCLLQAVFLNDTQDGGIAFTCQTGAYADDYVLFPACCYDGNRFNVLKRAYPPQFLAEEARIHMPVTITDVPRLNKDGSGCIEVTTGDLSVPCVGIFIRKDKEAIFLFTIQEIGGINLGLSYEQSQLTISWPPMRRQVYRWPFMDGPPDKGVPMRSGQKISIPYRLLRLSCADLPSFFRLFFEHRKCMGLDDARADVLPWEKQYSILRDKFNALNWRPGGAFYGVATENTLPQVWQPGWVGGGMSSYALMKLGSTLEWERGMSTLRHLFRTQAPSGFFYNFADADGRIDCTSTVPWAKHWHLLRQSADCLFFLFKHFSLIEERGGTVPPDWDRDARKLADAFVSLWNRYGQFGQWVDVMTGELIIGGSTAAAIAPAGLVLSYKRYGNSQYLEVAQVAAQLFYSRDVLAGYTTGGPGEILQGPDSESAFGLLESMVVLYEHTGDPKWLKMAEDTACLCSTWVVAYNYRFPKHSEFARLGMKTTGAVFANVQNKHAAPGICTLSGDSLFKLYRFTGHLAWLELLQDVSFTITQYMSTAQRPILSWDVPKDASLLRDDNIRAERETLPSGFICERVNMSDWESERCVGGVFNGSCWSETSALLTLAEVYPLLTKYPVGT